MTILDWQMAIYRRLEDGLPHTPVHLEGVAESTSHPKSPTGMIKPFLIIWFGQLTNVTTSGRQVRDLCGQEDSGGSIKQGNFLVETVAPTGLALLQLENYVRGLLTGYRPDNQGELNEAGLTTIRDPLPSGIGDTLRFYKPIFFNGIVRNVPLRVPTVPPPNTMTLPVAVSLRTHCPEGHELIGENLIEESRGQGKTARRCRTCVNARARDNYARKKQSSAQ
ncbi:hypothetical protein [Rhodococcus qingshengii]|uniref:hypothetical protein n=1 Tax=Rhodococcus qingshengii TaxID=334542 RepID=UPI0035D57D29